MALLPELLSWIEAGAYATSGWLWWKGSRLLVPIVEPTWKGIDDVKALSQGVAAASWWNRWAAIGAATGAGAHILGMVC
jgi:hypothetical protein